MNKPTNCDGVLDGKPGLCPACQRTTTRCFCGAPRTQELYEARLRWANITHPTSDDLGKQIERILAEPEGWIEFAARLEREGAGQLIAAQDEIKDWRAGANAEAHAHDECRSR